MISSGVSFAGNMTTLLLKSKSTNTNKSDFSGFNRLGVFIKKHGYYNIFTDPIHIALYITHLIDRHCSPNVTNNAIYAIKWALCSLFKDSNNLMIIRDLAIIALSFAGILRFDELSS